MKQKIAAAILLVAALALTATAAYVFVIGPIFLWGLWYIPAIGGALGAVWWAFCELVNANG